MSAQRRALAASSLLALALLAGCTAAPAAPTAVPDGSEADSTGFVLAAPELDAEGYLPDSARGNVEQYCGDGDNVSPLLEWTGVPEGTEGFVLLMTDPNYEPYDHWVVTGIPADATSLAPAVDGAVELGVVGATTRASGDYVGPCQADNGYRYTLYALDTEVVGTAETTRAEALELIDGHVLAEAYVEAQRR